MASRPLENPLQSALFTDLYELTMAQAYQAESMEEPAVFELFFRKMPEAGNYMVAAGLEDVLDYLENLRFNTDDLEWLRRREQFSPAMPEAPSERNLLVESTN